MAGTASESSGVVRSLEGSSSGCQSSEALAVWRSSDQVENGTPSTSPPYWDSDDDDDDGPKPSQLFGKHTMRIEKFSQINKREHRGEIFEAGGHQWYILIYPQGCDVCNHLSLFLCVNQPEKLLPGWSHFAQFTIAVVNKDPKKSKYSDTLHRFWRKEHDWGWKKFMELSKVVDGFLDGDTLIIKAQVQVIREKPDRPFRCLDCSYRRELVRVYLTNVEQICRRFVEERRVKLVKLLEDKARWSSFCDFWMGIDQNARRRMSRERSDSVLKVLVKHFFIEKEVTSTLVMDSLHSGLLALQGQTKGKKVRGTYSDAEETLTPILCMEKDAFVLVDDVLLLLERAAMETLPPKDEKGPQNRTKDGSSGEDFGKDSIERDERRLTELGRRTIEIFVLAHLFSKIDVAYQEVVALRRQEELIREEEEAWMAESEQKSKRGIADKDKKSKKKQGKQKRNNRKGKEKGRDEKQPSVVVVEDKPAQEIPTDIRNHSLIEEAESVVKAQLVEDVSDVLDSIDCVPEIPLPDSEERRDSDPSEIHRSTEISTVQNGERKCSSTVDDSSSTCSTHSLPSVVMNGLYKGNSVPKQKSQKSPSRGRNQQVEKTNKATGGAIDTKNQPYDAWQADDESCSCKVTELEDALVSSLQNHKKWQAEQEHVMKKENISMQSKPIVKKEDPDVEKPAKVKPAGVPSSPRRPSKNLPSFVQSKSESKISAVNDTLLVKKPANLAETIATSKPCVHKAATTPKPTKKPTTQEVPALNEKPTAHQVPASIEKPTAQQVPASTEKPTAQQVPAPNEKPTAQQAPAPSEKLTAQHDSASTEKPKAHQPSERPMAQQVMVTAEKPTTPQFMSRPLSAPIIPAPRAPAPVVSMVQTAPLLSRSVSAAGRLGPDPSSATPNYMGQSYRNAMMGNHVVTSSSGYIQPLSPNSPVNISNSYSHPSVSGPIYLSQSPERMDLNSIRPSLSFGMVSRDVLQNGPQYMDSPLRDSSRSMNYDPSMLNNMQNGPQWKDRIQRNSSRSIDGLRFPIEYPAGLSGHQNPNGVLADEFPHIDIINDLLDDENGIVRSGLGFQPFANGPHHVNHQQQFSFQNDIGMSGDVGTSTSTCRFEYDDFHCSYIPAGGQLDSNLIPQANLQPYPSNSGQIDGLVPNQWQIGGSDLSYLGMGSSDSDGFSHHIPEYSNLASGVNGYTVFRPTNGH